MRCFDDVFDSIDVLCLGYVTAGQVYSFCQHLGSDLVDWKNLIQAFVVACGENHQEKCHRDEFKSLLCEIERRQMFIERLAWDFKALDNDGDGVISSHCCLFLIQRMYGDGIGQRIWTLFKNLHRNCSYTISFYHLKEFLCSLPFDLDSLPNENIDQSSVDELKLQDEQKQFESYKQLQSFQADELSLSEAQRTSEDNATKLRQSSSALLRKMEEKGLDALLDESSSDEDEVGGFQAKHSVSAVDILDLLTAKYDLLSKKIILEMLMNSHGIGLWSALPPEIRASKLSVLHTDLWKLKGAEQSDGKDRQGGSNNINLPYFRLFGSRFSEHDINEADRGQESTLGDCYTYASVIDMLYKHRESEKSYLLSAMINGTVSTKQKQNHYLQLLIQIERIKNERCFNDAVAAINIAETLWDTIWGTQDDASSSGTAQQKQQSHLAKQRLDNNKSQGKTGPQGRTFRLNVAGLGLVDQLCDIVELKEHGYVTERQWMYEFLHGKDSIRFRMDANRISYEERLNQLKVLNAQHDKLKTSLDDKDVISKKRKKILFEAAALVVANRKEQQAKGRKVDAAVSLMVDLQSRQDQSYCQLFKIDSFNTDQCAAWKRSFYGILIEEELVNIATVLFGDLGIDSEKETLDDALDGKYLSIRMKILLDVLKDEYGEQWRSYNNDEKAKRLMTLKVKEKGMRDNQDSSGLSRLTQNVYKGTASNLLLMMGVDRQSFINHLDSASLNEDSEGVEEVSAEGNCQPLSDLWTRQCCEADHLQRKMKSVKDGITNITMVIELIRLRSQKVYADHEPSFPAAAITVGLFERNQHPPCKRLKRDLERHRILAEERLTQLKKNNFKVIVNGSVQQKNGAYGDCCYGVLIELDNCHRIERACLAQLLLDHDAEDLRRDALAMSIVDCLEQLGELSFKFQQLDISFQDDRDEHWAILEMASAIKYSIAINKSKKIGRDLSLECVCVELLVELQLIQHHQYEEFIDSFSKSDSASVEETRLELIKKRNNQALENLTELLFRYDGDCSDNEIMEAVESKHDVLMDKLIMEALEKEFGDAQWQMMSERERQERLLRMRLEQKRLMKDGRFEEAARLLGEGFEAVENMKSLMADKRKRVEENLKDRLSKRQKLSIEGRSSDSLDAEIEDLETALKQTPTTASLLEDLQSRFEEEKNALLSNLRGVDGKFLTEQMRQNKLVQLRREKQAAMMESKYDAASLVIMLSKCNKQGLDAKNKVNRERQEALARERLKILKARQVPRRDQEVSTICLASDRSTQESNAYKHMHSKHDREREVFVELLQSIGRNNVKEIEEGTTQSQREAQLEATRIKLMSKDPLLDSGYKQLLTEAASLRSACRYSSLKHINQDIDTDEAIHVSLLADLQAIQDDEVNRLTEDIALMPMESLVSLQQKCLDSNAMSVTGHCCTVLLQPEPLGVVTETVLIDALTSQYDALKDRLILEGLEKQLGEAEWARLSEQERQEKLLKIRLEEKRLRKEGEMDELQRLFMGICDQEKHVHDMIGESKALQEQRLKERLAKRKERAARGLSEAEINALEKEDDAKFEADQTEQRRKNPLLQLQENYDAECAAILSCFRDASSSLSTERDRQMELARLRRNQRIAQREDKFDAVAMVIGLANRQSDQRKQKMESDRLRQEQLAKERLANRMKLRHKSRSDGNAIIPNDLFSLKELLVQSLESEHEVERTTFVDLLNSIDKTASLHLDRSAYERALKRSKLMEQLNDIISINAEADSNSNMDDQTMIYSKSLILSLEECIKDQSHDGTDSTDHLTAAIDKAGIHLLADLQEQQDLDLRQMTESISTKGTDELQALVRINSKHKQPRFKSLIQLLLGKHLPRLDDTSDEGILQALQMKYDIVQEKLIADHLTRKYTIEVWEQFSVSEKQAKIEDFIAQQSTFAWSSSNGEAGLFDNEATTNSSKNPLDVIKNQYDKERDALLASLRCADNKLADERERQIILAKLKRDRLMLKREQNVENVALVFSLAKENYDKVEHSKEKEKERQLKLAQLRLAARKKAIQSKLVKDVVQDDGKRILDILLDDSAADAKEADETSESKSREDVLMEMNLRHANEIELTMRGIEDARKILESSENESTWSMENWDDKVDGIRIEYSQLKKETMNLQKKYSHVDKMGESERAKYCADISRLQKRSAYLLVSSLIAKMKCLSKEMDDGRTDAEILASVQQQQQVESNAMTAFLMDKERNEVDALKVVQRSMRYCQLPESAVISLIVKEQGTQDVESIDSIENEIKEKLSSLEVELETTRQQKRTQGMTEDEIELAMKELKEQHERNSKNIREAAERQKKAALQRLQKMKRQKEAKMFEEDIAASLMMAANQQMTLVREKTAMIFTKQKDSLGNRLRERIALKKKKDEEASAAVSRSKEIEEKNDAQSRQYKLPEGMGLRREKTVVEEAAEMEESKKKEIVGFLMREQTGVALKMQKEQQRQEDRVRSIRIKLRKRMEDREQEAATLIGHVERQKTIVLNNRKEERNRQITTIRERVARIKYERTLTQKETGSNNKNEHGKDGFQSLLGDDATDGLSKDEAMVRVAERIEKHFREEQQLSSKARDENEAEKDLNVDTELSPDDRLREMQLKERFAKRRKTRQAQKRDTELQKQASDADKQDATS